ncbi:hypothetical protein [Methylobacterium persicinum]|uniref:Uncharacterized protein n=1 Tax=Methylobacterium persicinum TaxID=374426 RepID=A0ABU0HFP0_9HYPH|nr:hypothetical protein [Methylobacterium persicinum]MDQ0441140.1 hypothetical protein [Methylobacterium persicinum]GJE40613.1 hypothetical protein KHHGKMAE_4708 [Methylobacterium persicinum]
MLQSNLYPPLDGPNADPILYGVAAGLAELFPLIDPPQQIASSHRDMEGGRDRSDETAGQE